MKHVYIILTIAATGCLMAFSSLTITGRWVGYLLRPNSTDSAKFMYDLQQSNNVLTGSVIGPDGGAVPLDSGKVDGNKFTFYITEQAYGQAKITGTYFTDSLSSNVTFPSGKTIHLKMIRSN